MSQFNHGQPGIGSVIPAQAGIQMIVADATRWLDSRLRGNDRDKEAGMTVNWKRESRRHRDGNVLFKHNLLFRTRKS